MGQPIARTAGGNPPWRTWRYTGGRRDLRLDFLRGFAVFAMVADHLEQPGTMRSWLSYLTGGNRFLVSMAEVFVFISGLVLGIVSCRVIAEQGVTAALRKVCRRVLMLYVFTMVATFVFAGVSTLTEMPWGEGKPIVRPVTWVVAVLTLHRAYAWCDVLLLYVLLVGCAPLALLLLHHRRTVLLLAGSWVLWALAQRWPTQLAVPWRIENNPIFPFAAWQVLFYTGLAIGYHRGRLAGWARRISLTGYLAVLAALATVLILAQVHSVALLARVTPGSDPVAWGHQYFGKAELRIGRLLAFAVVFGGAFALVTVLWRPLVTAFGWLFLPLGQHALLGYGLHLGVLVLFTATVPVLPGVNETDPWVNSLVQLTGVGMVWVGVRFVPVARELATALGARITAMVMARQ